MGKREPVRLSSVVLFKRNILDPPVLISTCVIYLLCNIILSKHVTAPSFLIVFSILCWLFHHHLESYRSFRVVSKCTRLLESKYDRPALRSFLSTHLRYIKPNYVFEHPKSPVPAPARPHGTPGTCTTRHDTYRWMNKVILFSWPYLSHVVHHQLNEFLTNSSALAHSDTGLKRLLYAFLRQIDANILAIEHCELGSNAPYIKSIHVLEENDKEDTTKRSLVYDLNLVYEGNMNIAFVCRYFCCCSSRLGLKDVFVNLNSRLVVGPIDSFVPSIERIAYSLLELPQFGYKGIALVELAELKIARRSINKLIKQHLLFPKAVSLKVADVMEIISEKQRAAQGGRDNFEADASEPLDDDYPDQLPWTTRLAAQLMFFACICSNFCLRCCQSERPDIHSQERVHDSSDRRVIKTY